MSRQVHEAPLAVACDGTVFVNLAQYEVGRTPVELLDHALAVNGEIFIGVSLQPHEVDNLVERLSHGAREAAAFMLGARRPRRS